MLRRQEGGARGTGDGAVGQSGEAGGLGSALGTGTGPLERGRGPLASQFCPSSRRLWPEALQIAELEGRWKLAWGSRARNVPRPDARGVFHGARRVCVFLTEAVREVPTPFGQTGRRMGVSYTEAIVFTHRCLLSRKAYKCTFLFLFGASQR